MLPNGNRGKFDVLNFAYRAAFAGALFTLAGPALADPSVVPPSAAATPVDAQPVVQIPAAPASYILPALFAVDLTVVDEVSSKVSRTGDPVKLRLARPLYVTPDLGLPEGTIVEGIVIHAAKGGMGGKSGELLIAAQRIVLDNMVAIALRSFQVGPAQGRDNQGVAMGLMIAGGAVGGIAGMLITGGSARVAAGTNASAKTRTATELPAALLVKLPRQDPAYTTPMPVPALITQGK